MLCISLTVLTACNSNQGSDVTSSQCTTGNEKLYENTSRSGALIQNERWKGAIKVTGDILIGSNCTLTIEAGTTVSFAKSSDDTNHGSSIAITDDAFPNDPANKASQMSGIDLLGGTLIAKGTMSNLITFTSTSSSPSAGDWHSIAYRSASSSMTIEYSKIKYAYYGIQVSEVATNNNVKIRNNTIDNIVACGICMGVDALKTVTLTVSGNTISGCGHEGIDLHPNASIIIENNMFYNNRGKFVSDPTSVGGNGIVVDKSNTTIIRNNIFENNNQGITCVTNGTNPTIVSNTFGIGGNANDENIQTCPR